MFNKERRDDFYDRIKGLYPEDGEDLIMFAYNLAVLGHENQERDGGGEFVDHPIRVALILVEELAEEDVSSDMVIAALLHDVIEDAKPNENHVLTWKSLVKVFGGHVHYLVDALTKRKKAGETRAQYFDRIEIATEEARIIKLADRLDNVRELSSCTPEKQAWYLDETRKHLIPLAERTNTYLAHELILECGQAERQLQNTKE